MIARARRSASLSDARLPIARLIRAVVIAARRQSRRNFRALRLVCNGDEVSSEENVAAPELNCMDRRIIRVDMPPAHAGITAALRRAFEAAASEPCDRDFAELLRRLN